MSRAADELAAETTAYSVCASSEIDPGEYSISYLAGWSENPVANITPAELGVRSSSVRSDMPWATRRGGGCLAQSS